MAGCSDTIMWPRCGGLSRAEGMKLVLAAGVSDLDRVAAKVAFRISHRVFPERMLHQRCVIVLMHMVWLGQVVPAQFCRIHSCMLRQDAHMCSWPGT